MRKKKIKDKKIKNILLNQKGMALLTTLIFIFILVTFGVALLSMTSNDLKLSALQRDSTKAFYIAEAGIERTLYNLKEDHDTDQNWLGAEINNQPFEDGKLYGGEQLFYDGADEGIYEGTYTVYLSNLTSSTVTIKSIGVYNNKSTRYVQVDAWIGPPSIWDNAIFAGKGQDGKAINGNVDIRGSVHILGTEGEVSVEVLDVTGKAGIGNNYVGMDSIIRDRITGPPKTYFNEETIDTLKAILRVQYGKVKIASSGVTFGNPDEPGNGYKETLDGIYTSGFEGFENNIYSDNGKDEPYDFKEGTFHFPKLNELYIDPETGETFSGGTIGDDELCSYKEYYGIYGLNMHQYTDPSDSSEMITVSSISSDTESFWYPDPEEDEPEPGALTGDYIYWDKAEGKLYISGIIVIHESITDFTIGDKHNKIEYVGVGTIVSENMDGGISIHGDLLAEGEHKFPVDNVLGLVAYNDLNLETESQLNIMGAFYAENQITSAKQNQVAGTFVSNYFNMTGQVPSIYQVPGLEYNLPPGMPGAGTDTRMYTSNWHEVHK